MSQYALVITYQSIGRFKDPVELLEKVVEIRAGTLLEGEDDCLSAQNALALVYAANGQPFKTIELLGAYLCNNLEIASLYGSASAGLPS